MSNPSNSDSSLPSGGARNGLKSSDQSATMTDMDEVDDTAVEIDLALNTNFDPSFFDVVGGWSDATTQAIAEAVVTKPADAPSTSASNSSNIDSAVLMPPAASPSAPVYAATPSALSQHQPPSQQLHQASLASARQAVGPVSSNPPGVAALPAAASLVPQHQLQPPKPSSTTPPTGGVFFNNNPASAAPSSNIQQQQQASASDASDLPPFLLFDAPIELRANFMAAQRAHGLPPLQDTNTAHYQQPPQQQQQPVEQHQQPQVARKQPRLVDGRHGYINKKDRNVREQKRTQKIADLIDQVRRRIDLLCWTDSHILVAAPRENGEGRMGIGSEIKVPHTFFVSAIHRLRRHHVRTHRVFLLSLSCAEYVKHLVQVNKEKEKALEKIKRDLEEKRRKMEEDKQSQQNSSDPESTTSTLTVSSTEDNNVKKRAHDDTDGDSDPARKKQYTMRNNSSNINTGQDSSQETSSSANSDPARDGQSVEVNRMATSSISDLTDSNKEGSSSEGNSSDQQQDKKVAAITKEGGDAQNNNNPGSIVSDAAVAPGVVGSHVEVIRPTDVSIVFSNGGNSRNADAGQGRGVHHSESTTEAGSSSSSSFELDYKEVFLKSNVPQIISTTSGRIIAWNDFFLRATGLQTDAVSRLTIFSLVRSNKLANLFDIVAASLRTEDGEMSSGSNSTTASTHATAASNASSKQAHFTAITLPCTNFCRDAAIAKPLYMTVTLMRDEDPRKRCFHCVFTDCPGTNGMLGMVTPELLSKLFSKPGAPSATDTTTSSS